MIITIDTETQSLNTQAFIMGVITHQNGKSETFNSKKDMWKRIMHLAERHRIKKECLLVYAHNMMYDFLAIRPTQLPEGMYQFCHNPFIMDMEDTDGKIYLKFLSTTSLFQGSLAQIGEALGNPKTETPEWLKEETYEPNFLELQEARNYMIQDSKVLMDFVLTLKKKLNDIGVRPRHLITAPQVGINYMMQQLKKQAEKPEAFFENYNRRILWKPMNPEMINQSARAGRVECFKLGTVKNATHIDINSLWPYCMQHMKMPDLRTENKIIDPLNNGYTQKEILNKIGISSIVIESPECNYGVLPIRPSSEENYYPNTKQLLIGTWTHQEIRKAIENGYVLHKIKESLTWEETTNPFKEIIQEIYEKKRTATNDMDRYIWKMLLNGSIGKFKQRRYYTDYKWLLPSEEQEYLDKGYECIEIWENKRLYAKKGNWNYPHYSAPILYSLITADARLRMYEDFKRIPREKMYYCDTDCIIADDKAIKNAKFIYTENIGDYKIENENVDFLCYGKKNYMIGETIKASGVGRLWRTPEDFKRGYLTYKKMLTEHTTADTNLIGTFEVVERDLWETMARTEQTQRSEKQALFQVDHTHDITEYDTAITTWMHSKEYTPSEQQDSASYS